MQIALAPMEGLVDDLLRELLTGVGGVDWCVTEFIRVTDQLLPVSVYRRLAPELAHGARTPAGTPMRVQLLGSDPACLADNAAFACTLGAPVIDLNFGCPANTVNRSRGGAVLLKEPELLHRIVREVRRAVPAEIPVTAKMRLGYETPDGALESAQALADGGASMLVVHARTKLDGYKPPAHWEWIARVQDAVTVPVFANGEIWTVEDWRRCRAISGVDDVMLGRGLVCRPDLALQIAAAREGRVVEPMGWDAVLTIVERFWQLVCEKLPSRFAPGRIKQWLKLLTRTYPQARVLFQQLKAQEHSDGISTVLAADRPSSGLASSCSARTLDRALPA